MHPVAVRPLRGFARLAADSPLALLSLGSVAAF